MPTAIVTLLLLAALALLASSVLSGRRGRDPAGSVDSFQRALSAMSTSADTARATAASGVADEVTESDDAVVRR